MSEERNCDERYKWKFDKFGTRKVKSEKPKKFTFCALLVILENLKLGFSNSISGNFTSADSARIA